MIILLIIDLLFDNVDGNLFSYFVLLISMVSAMPVTRIRQLLDTYSVIRPEYTWDVANADRSWDHSLDVSAAFAVPEMVELTCPLSFNKEGICTIWISSESRGGPQPLLKLVKKSFESLRSPPPPPPPGQILDPQL